jgi:hypothetical protein
MSSYANRPTRTGPRSRPARTDTPASAKLHRLNLAPPHLAPRLTPSLAPPQAPDHHLLPSPSRINPHPSPSPSTSIFRPRPSCFGLAANSFNLQPRSQRSSWYYRLQHNTSSPRDLLWLSVALGHQQPPAPACVRHWNALSRLSFRPAVQLGRSRQPSTRMMLHRHQGPEILSTSPG